MSEADTPNSSFQGNNDSFINDPIYQWYSPRNDESVCSPDDDNNNEANPSLEELLWTKTEESEEDTQKAELINELYQRNNQLLHRNAQLQKSLETAQAELEQQQWRLRQAEDLNTQHNDELNAAYEQNLSLSQELKSSRTKAQHQEEKIAHLTQYLQTSQQRVAQLERECALIQQHFQEQSHKLIQAEKQARELSSRLQQQRRHTWQFKTALNKCLETNAQKKENRTIPVKSAPSQPIPAWSSEPTNFSEETEITNSLQQEESSTPANPVEGVEQTLDTMDFGLSISEFEQGLVAKSDQSSSEAPNTIPNRKKRKSYAAVELPKFIRR